MKFDKNKNENKNFEILRKEIKKVKSPYSKILAETLFAEADVDVFRNKIKENVSKYIDSKLKGK